VPNQATEDNLCLERARVSVSWAKLTDRPFLLADPDIEFLAPPRIHPEADVQLLWRTSKPDQPVNSGVVWSKPGLDFFWTHYGKIAINLPQRTHGWFCDQLAYSLMTGVYHNPGDHITLNGTRVELVDAKDHCERPGKVRSGAWAHHHKGWSHKGEEFRQWYRVGAKSGDGRPSAECASSTAGVMAPSSALRAANSAST
jgi:hypothetical protein